MPNVLWIPPRWQPCTEWVHRKSKVTVRVYAGYHSILNEHGGDTATAEAFSGMTVDTTTAAPARKKKLPFYIAPEKLDEVELTDTCMLSELTNRINALCEENDRKKLTASFINQLLVEKDILRKPCREKKR